MMEEYVALDLETTGLSPKTDRILEIGAVKVINGRAEAEYSTLVDPRMAIPYRITQLTGITGDMVAGQPEARAAVSGLVEFCEGFPILGHNLMFDYSFVKHSAVNFGLPFEKEGMDTLKIARVLLADLPSRSLQCLRVHYGIRQDQAHRALDDARTAHLLYERMKQEYGDENPRLFNPVMMEYKVKKQGPVTMAQKHYLQDLVKYHKINLDVEVDSMTKNEASRLIDTILSSYGRIVR